MVNKLPGALERSVTTGQLPWWWAQIPNEDTVEVSRSLTPELYDKLSDSFDNFFLQWMAKGGETPPSAMGGRDDAKSQRHRLQAAMAEKYGQDVADQMKEFISKKFFEPIPEEEMGVKSKPEE